MKVWDDRLVLLQVGGSEPIEREHDERRTDEAEKHKNDKADWSGNITKLQLFSKMVFQVSIEGVEPLCFF